MKQSLQVARWRASIAVVLAITILCAACVTLPRSRTGAVDFESTRAVDPKRINLNTASVADLERLPGIGKITAERIVSHREQYGPFRRPEHVLMVRGISVQKFRAIRARITVN